MPELPEVRLALDASFLTKERFATEIEHIVRSTGCNYIDAIVEYCEDKSIDIDTVGKLMSKPLKEKLKNDADLLNYLRDSSSRSTAVLPI